MSKFSYFKRTGKGVAERWRKSYVYRHSTPDYWGDKNKRGIYDALVALGDDPDPDQVDDVIGNGSWTRVVCSGNDEHGYVDEAVIIDTCGSPAVLCMACFAELKAVIEDKSQ